MISGRGRRSTPGSGDPSASCSSPPGEDIADFGLSPSQVDGQFSLPDKDSETEDAAAERWLRLATRPTAIAGGSTFIQRNIVAERILGMPRE